jgi:hypothetical protein
LFLVKRFYLLFSLTFSPLLCFAAEQETKPFSVSFGGFIDTFYAFDFDTPASPARNYGNPLQLVTTPGRQNEFNINMAYLDAKLTSDRVRGRLALQAGTSVEAVYLTEILNDTTPDGSTATLLRHLQEAYVGYRIADGLWVDAGVYLSYIGFESIISKDNWTYSRSFMADFSPYYFAGVKLTYDISSKVSLQFHVTNGWQDVIETNSNKAVGTAFAYTPSDAFSFQWNTFYGEETGTLWRVFNDFVAKVSISQWLQIAATADIGVQRPSSVWYGLAVFLRYRVGTGVHLTARYEHYADPDRVIVQPTDATTAFVADSASLNLDVELVKNLLWRTEVRGYWAMDPVFPAGTGLSNQDWLAVSSLSYGF